MTKELLKVDLFFCKKEMENLKAKAPEMQRKHLQKRLEFHQKAGNEKAIVDVTRIIRYESDEKRYNRLRWSTKPKQGGSVYNVRIKNGDTEEVINTEEGIFKHVSEHLSDQFRLTFTAKCYNGKLFDDIGFIGDTDAARSILEGTYNYPPDLDTATKLLFEEAVITYSKIPKEELATYVTVEDYQYYWQRANKRISSSYSGLHFGHYKAAALDPHLLALHAQKLTLCAKTGIPLARWGRGVTVLLEKICGNNYVNQLRAICLFEADFNWWNKLIFAHRMMQHAGKHDAIPEEIFTKKGSQCIDAIMCKTFLQTSPRFSIIRRALEGLI